MKIEIVPDNFTCPFSDLIDKERYEAYPITGVENGWVVKKIEKPKEVKK